MWQAVQVAQTSVATGVAWFWNNLLKHQNGTHLAHQVMTMVPTTELLLPLQMSTVLPLIHAVVLLLLLLAEHPML